MEIGYKKGDLAVAPVFVKEKYKKIKVKKEKKKRQLKYRKIPLWLRLSSCQSLCWSSKRGQWESHSPDDDADHDHDDHEDHDDDQDHDYDRSAWVIIPLLDWKGSPDSPPGTKGLKSIRLTWASGKNLQTIIRRPIMMVSISFMIIISFMTARQLPFSSWYDGMLVHIWWHIVTIAAPLLVCINHLMFTPNYYHGLVAVTINTMLP